MSGDFWTSPSFSESKWYPPKRSSTLPNPKRYRIEPLSDICSPAIPDNTLQIAFPRWPRRESIRDKNLITDTLNEAVYADRLQQKLEHPKSWLQEQLEGDPQNLPIETATKSPIKIPRLSHLGQERDEKVQLSLAISTPKSFGRLEELWQEYENVSPLHLPCRAMFIETTTLVGNAILQRMKSQETGKNHVEECFDESCFIRQPIIRNIAPCSALSLASRISSIARTVASIQLSPSNGQGYSTPSTSSGSKDPDHENDELQTNPQDVESSSLLLESHYRDGFSSWNSLHLEYGTSQSPVSLNLTQVYPSTNGGDKSQVCFILPSPQIPGLQFNMQREYVANTQLINLQKDTCYQPDHPPLELMICTSELLNRRNAKRKRQNQEDQRQHLGRHVSFASEIEVIPPSAKKCLNVTRIGKHCTTSWWQRLVPWIW